MIISCPNCKKQFKIDHSLIPNKGRDLKCGSCDYVWFYIIDNKKLEPISSNDDFADNKDKSVIFEKKIDQIIEKKKSPYQNKIDDKITSEPNHDHIIHFLNLKNLNIIYFKKLSA